VRGPVSVRWERRGGRLRLDVTVPANATAQVLVPSTDGEVTEGGSPAASLPGVAFTGRQGDRSVYAIGSGSYSFESRW